jgi:PQQ-like domain
LPKRFSVSAYPSLLVLGRQAENIYRFSGYKPPKDFLPELERGLQRYGLYQKGEAWDVEPARPEHIVDVGTVRTIPAPSDATPSGLAFVGERLWVAQGATLAELDPASGKVLQQTKLPANVRGLCSDGKLLYAVEYGWTAGLPIWVVDPATGKTTRQIVTEANKKNRSYSAAAVEFRAGQLWVLAAGGVRAVDPATGEVTRLLQLQDGRPAALAFDGEHFVTGSSAGIQFVDPETGNTVRQVPTNYPVRAVAWHAGKLYVMEQPIWGFDRQHSRVQVWPKQTLIHEIELPAAGNDR